MKVAFVVPKKRFKKAIDRNKIKRQITAAFRQNKHEIYSHYISKKFALFILFIYNADEFYKYENIEEAIIKFNKHLYNKINFNIN